LLLVLKPRDYVGSDTMISVKENNGNANTYLAANMLSKDHIENVLLID